MGLAGEYELHRHHGVVDYLVEPIQVAEQQSGPLVGRETPGKAYSEHVAAQGLPDLHDLLGRIVTGYGSVGQLLVHRVYERLLQNLAHRPHFGIWNTIDAFEAFLVVVMSFELFAEHPGVHGFPFLGAPCRIVDSVGDIADEQLFGEIALVHGGEYVLAHLAVEH